MTTPNPPKTMTVREYAADRGITVRALGGGWKADDKLCRQHFTGYNPGCMVCRKVCGR